MTAEQLIADAASLPVAEQLRVVQAIWDALPDSASPSPDPGARAEFDRRMDHLRKNPETAMTIDELRERLDADTAE